MIIKSTHVDLLHKPSQIWAYIVRWIPVSANESGYKLQQFLIDGPQNSNTHNLCVYVNILSRQRGFPNPQIGRPKGADTKIRRAQLEKHHPVLKLCTKKVTH